MNNPPPEHCCQTGNAQVAGYFLFLLILVLTSFPANINAAPIAVIDEKTETLSLNTHVDILDNPNGEYSLKHIIETSVRNEFAPVDLSDRNAFRFYSNTFWLRFSLSNHSSQQKTLWLQGNDASIKEIRLFYAPSDVLFSKYFQLAENALFQDEDLNPILKEISIPPNSTYTYYMDIASIKNHTFNLELIKHNLFLQESLVRSRVFSFGLGLLCLLATISVIIALARKSLVLLYQSVFILANIGAQITGLGNVRGIYPEFGNWQYSAIFCFFYIGTTAGLLSTAEYLKTAHIYGKYNDLIKWVIKLNTLVFIVVLFIINAYSPLILLPVCIALPPIIMAMAHCYHKHGDRFAFWIGLTMVLSAIIFTFTVFFRSSTFGLHLLIDPYVLYLIIFEMTLIASILILREYSLQEEVINRKQLVRITETYQNAQNEMLSEVSHDMRTPLSGILGMADLLKSSNLSADQLEKLDAIKNAGQVMLNKISEIHYHVKLQQNPGSIQKSPFELSLLIEACASKFQLQAEQKNIEFIIAIQPDVPDIVIGDEPRLRQILIQIIENAIKNTEQGEVLIKVSKQASGPDAITFSVTDTGKGLTPEERLTLNSYKSFRNNNENHVGLPMAIQLLDQLDTELNISSVLGEGSNFSFTLDLPRVDPLGENTRTADNILLNKNLLIIDDNHTCCKVLKQQAISWGMHVKEAYDGHEALAMFRAKKNMNEPFDAVLIDYDMPQQSGIEVAEKILKESGQPPLMIMLCGLTITPPEHISRKAGIATVLNKPASQKLVKLTLANLLRIRPDIQHDKKTAKELHILIADDNDVSRRVISKMIDTLGMTYKLVSDGQLALDAIKREQFDLILMDCEMPFMNGFESCRRIHRWQHEMHRPLTPVFALTAHTLGSYKEKSADAGMAGFLEKPVNMVELQAILQEISLEKSLSQAS